MKKYGSDRTELTLSKLAQYAYENTDPCTIIERETSNGTLIYDLDFAGDVRNGISEFELTQYLECEGRMMQPVNSADSLAGYIRWCLDMDMYHTFPTSAVRVMAERIWNDIGEDLMDTRPTWRDLEDRELYPTELYTETYGPNADRRILIWNLGGNRDLCSSAEGVDATGRVYSKRELEELGSMSDDDRRHYTWPE